MTDCARFKHRHVGSAQYYRALANGRGFFRILRGDVDALVRDFAA